MYFLEEQCFDIKIIKDAAGLSNTTCKMPLNQNYWKPVAVCEKIEPLKKAIKKSKPKVILVFQIIKTNQNNILHLNNNFKASCS